MSSQSLRHGKILRKNWSKKCLCLIGACLLVVTSGCQTWVPELGMTLPSPRYLEHPPQPIEPTPPFPLPREAAALEAAWAAQRGPGGAPVPPGLGQ